MTPQELRIGNWIYPSKKLTKFLRIQEIRKETVMLSDWLEVSHKVIEPIPLTEEVLLKLGFVKEYVDLRSSAVPHAYVGLRYNKGEFRYYKESDKWSYRATRIDNPVYLHHLQNLYYDLTGTELKIKL